MLWVRIIARNLPPGGFQTSRTWVRPRQKPPGRTFWFNRIPAPPNPMVHVGEAAGFI